MITLIASVLGFGGVAGVAAQAGSVHGPSDCPVCCGRSAATQGTDHSPQMSDSVLLRDWRNSESLHFSF